MDTDAVKPPPLVLVIWEDAVQLDADRWVEHQPYDEYEPAMIYTVGFLLHESKAGVIVTSHWNETHTGPVDQIPRAMIRKMRRLRGVL